jgi:hypothetical protein
MGSERTLRHLLPDIARHCPPAGDSAGFPAHVSAKMEAAMAALGPNEVLTREKAAAALSNLGYPVTKGVLATLASRGGGPHYRRFGRRVIYRGSDLLAWAESRASAEARS